MRIKKIENTSNEDVHLDLGEGSQLTLRPGSTFRNVRVENLDQIKDRVKVTSDLGEIREDHSGPVKLFD
jgi:hypothetical protein